MTHDHDARPTRRQRRKFCRQAGFGHREVNDWGSGRLPAPYAEGDLLWLPEPYFNSRMRDMGEPGWYVVTCGFSIDGGDAWYFRVSNDPDNGSDRLHVAVGDRSDMDDVDWMAPFEMVDTSDPEGLATRERLLSEGWSYTPPERCPHCERPI